MNPLLGIISNPKQSNIAAKNTKCFDEVQRRFPSAFVGADSVGRGALEILGDLQSATDAHDTLYFYGELFNSNELAATTSIPPSADNAALVLALISAKGIEAVKLINGQFVIVYYQHSQNMVSIIGDHLGVQQLLYYCDDELFLFGSEVKLMMTHPGCPKGIDWAAALRRPQPQIALASYKSHDTWFKGINLLPEGSMLQIDLLTFKTSIKSYWKPKDTQPAVNDTRTAEQVMEQYAALLEDAVKIRMEDKGTTHSLLSGGLDSSAICSLAARNGTVETFSIINQTTVLEDTTSYCARMAAEMNFENKQFLVPYHRLCFNADLWKQRVWRAESPVNHTDSLTKTLLHYAIRKAKPEVKCLLTGTGSDQMNGGLVGYIAQVTDDPNQTWDNFQNEILDVERRTLIARSEDSLWQCRKFVSREFLADISGKEIEKNPWMIYVDGCTHSEAYSLLWDEQRASASHGHITRYPFLDYRIAEFIAAVPERLHKELFIDKRILREPSKHFLPDYIVNKPKMPYNLPEYDFRAELYAFLTADGPDSLFIAAFGDIETPHPVIDKKMLYSRILAMQQNPDILEWLNIMHIINLGLLEQLGEKSEQDLNYEALLEVPAHIEFDEPESAIVKVRKDLDVLTTDEMLDLPLKFAENCSLLLDTRTNKYYLSKRNNLTYEIDEEYKHWKQFLMAVDNKLSTQQVLQATGLQYADIEEFFMISLKEQILVTNDKKTGY